MFRPEIIRDYYTRTPIYFWPILWLELRMMGRYLSRLRDAGGDIDGMLCLSPYGTLHIVDMSPEANGYVDTEAWRPTYTVTLESLTEYPPHPHLRRMPESQTSALIWQVKAHLSRRSWPSPGIRYLGTEFLYLDPG